MSVYHPVSVVKPDATQATASRPRSPEPVLITEQQVLFGTAAAVRSPARRNVVAMMSRAVSTVAEHWHALAERRHAHYYPPPCSYLEHSLMAREMDRL
ncbi:hypothetical protein [Mycolicibacterium sp. HK-90]|uniref:hypothetical protein n=1 Tax=Mycolicibacterium sp. HK-90 TaxID=3056937 RepID=UPI002659B795|nr:hypothetical protein [Mycolicibacterium sp. HK-90]WKG02267.1 hypothetical protein QU592_24045 [Mycolicibacterium sp. HK-90]